MLVSSKSEHVTLLKRHSHIETISFGQEYRIFSEAQTGCTNDVSLLSQLSLFLVTAAQWEEFLLEKLHQT